MAASKVYSGLCREHANEEARAWYASGSPAALARRGRAIAYRRSLVPIPTWWAEEVRAAFDRLCAYGCGRRGDTWDHIWPVSKGGVSAPGNLAPACGSCNSSKKNTEPTPWVERGLSAFPSQWLNLWDLAVQTGHDDWCSWNEAPWSTATVLTDSLEGAI
ncbi:HNH endonuclease [Streptomyces sp. NPDC058299]|uniref:HNH endonuclease n=1 Tax=Streptomyces sp. NPDC058299 TaxID=3346435 RepID=UPI0036E0B31C